jgi:hypothetical protein
MLKRDRRDNLMTKYELSLTRAYVPDWGLTDAVRELFQNALDQQTVNPDNKMFWDYNEEDETFSIGNKLSILEPQSLLLGSTTKADNANTIGQFGEGYKVATLVLNRLDKKVTFYNYGAREVWTSRFSKSKKYGVEILVFETDKKFPWITVPNNNLTITLENISLDEFSEIEETILHMRDDYPCKATEKGEILMDMDEAGRMYVNGLYISTDSSFGYGYNFKPSCVKLDRDRRLIPGFELKWTTAQMWGTLEDPDDDTSEAVVKLLAEDKPDVEFLRSANSSYTTRKNAVKSISNNVHESFVKEHGQNAIAITSTAELESVPEGRKPVIVVQSYKELLEDSDDYDNYEPEPVPELVDRVQDWLDAWKNQMPLSAGQELQEILDED